MQFGSLFAGIGGFDLGFERAGMGCMWQVENNKQCQSVLRYHWPNVNREVLDVKEFGRSNCPSPVDLICGGFPCQDLSVAGNRAGLGGERSGLWWEFHRIIGEIRPKWVVIENVLGLLSSNRGRDMGTLLGSLAQCGYGWAYRVLDAQYFGVAQRRRRVFIVGCLGDNISAAKVLFERESVSWDTSSSREKGKEIVAPLKASSPSRRGGGSWPIAEEFVVTSFCTNQTGAQGPIHSDDVTDILAQDHPPAVVANTIGSKQRSDLDTMGAYVPVGFGGYRQQLGTLRHSGGDIGGGSEVLIFDWQSGGDVRLNVSDAHTSALHVGQTPAVFHQPGVRRLTPKECERLQGFPDDFSQWGINNKGEQIEMSDTARYKMLGNAVVVLVAEWIGKRVLSLLV